jgi:hypothetical protein
MCETQNKLKNSYLEVSVCAFSTIHTLVSHIAKTCATASVTITILSSSTVIPTITKGTNHRGTYLSCIHIISLNAMRCAPWGTFIDSLSLIIRTVPKITHKSLFIGLKWLIADVLLWTCAWNIDTERRYMKTTKCKQNKQQHFWSGSKDVPFMNTLMGLVPFFLIRSTMIPWY